MLVSPTRKRSAQAVMGRQKKKLTTSTMAIITAMARNRRGIRWACEAAAT